MAEIELKSVTVVKDGNKVLKDINLKIESGEYVSLLGPTGSGPSYLLKVIAGLIPIQSGEIIINGKNVTDTPPEDRNVGFVFEQFNLFPHLSVIDNLLYGPRMRDEDLEEKREVAKEILTMVRLDGREDALTRELSGGMQQRVGVARAITAGAEIILLEQPYRALDAKIREELRYEIREIIKELGLTGLHSTHDKEEAMITADRIAVFEQGKLWQIDEPIELFRSPNSQFVTEFLSNSNSYRGVINDGTIIIEGTDQEIKVDSDLQGNVLVLLRHQDITIHRDKDKNDIESENKDNLIESVVIKTRLLGEFVRFTVETRNGMIITSRELLSLKHRTFRELEDQTVYIEIPPERIILFDK